MIWIEVTNSTNDTRDDDDSNGMNPSDALFHVPTRLIVLAVEIAIGTIGILGAFFCLWRDRRRKSRVNKLILHVTLADWLVVDVACVSQLIWECMPSREWIAGDFLCRNVKFLQSFAMMSSSFMVTLLAFDRHQAITSPLKARFSVLRSTLVGWSLAALMSTPLIAVFHTRNDNGTTVCENIFRTKPAWHRKLYITYASLIVFYIPLLLLLVFYIRIFCTIRRKASLQDNNKRLLDSNRSRVFLTATPSYSLGRAKIKTLLMTIVIVLTFIICSCPYHVVEMILTFGDPRILDPVWNAIGGGAAVANSCVNPYIFMIFQSKCFTARPLTVLHSSKRRTISVSAGNPEAVNSSKKTNVSDDKITFPLARNDLQVEREDECDKF